MTARLTITSADGLPPSSTIEVRVEHDDGYVAYATYRNDIRCWADTSERAVSWEGRFGDHWARVPEPRIELSADLRQSMARAAHAGLVACGARSVS